MSTLAVIAFVVGWLNSDDFQTRSIYLVEGLVEGATGQGCEVGKIKVAPWPPGLEIEQFKLYAKDTDETILSVARARAPLVLRDGGPNLGRVVINEPYISLHIEKGGKLREFQDIPTGDPNAPPGTPLAKLPWYTLEITDATIRVAFPHGTLAIDHLNFIPVDGPRSDLPADVVIDVRDLHEETTLDIRNITLGPEVIEIPELEFRSTPLLLTGRVRVPLQGELDVDLFAHIALEEINALLSPPRMAHGEVDIDIHLGGLPKDPRAEVVALGQRVSVDLPGVFTPILHYNLGNLSTAIIASRDNLHVENLTSDIGGGELIAWGDIRLPELRLENAGVVAHDSRLRRMLIDFDAAPTPWIDMGIDLEVSLEGSLKPLKLEGHFDFDVGDLKVGDRPIADPNRSLMLDIPQAYAKGTLLLEKDHVFLSAPKVVGPRTRGSMDVDIGFGPRGPLNLQVDMHHADLSDFQPLNGVDMTGTGRIQGKISGPFNKLQVHGLGDLYNFSVMGIEYADHLTAAIISPDMKSVELHGAQAMKGVTPYEGYFGFNFKPPMSMDVDVEFNNGRIEDVVDMFMDLPGMTADLSGTLQFHGPIYNLDGESHITLSDIDLWGEHFDYGEGHGYLDDGLFTLDDVRVLRRGGDEGMVLRGSIKRDWSLNMDLIADGMALQRLTTLADKDAPLTGNISAYSHISNTLFEPWPEGRISVTDVRYDGYPVKDSHLKFHSTDGIMTYFGGLLGGAAKVDGTLGLWDEQPYAMTLELTDLPAHSLYPNAADGTPLTAIVSGDLDISGDFGEEWSPVKLSADLPKVELQYAHHVLRNTSRWQYEQEGNLFKLKHFGLQGGLTNVKVSASGGNALLVGGEGTVDLDLLRAIVPSLERASGTADVVLYAVGAKSNVEAVIEIDVQADLLRYESLPPSFEDLTAHLRVTDTGIDIERLTANVGGGTMTGGGHITASGWIPARYDLTAEIRDSQVQWVDSLPPAIGNGSLHFDGPSDALLLSGRIDVQDMTFSDRIDWEDWVVEYRDEMLVDPSTLYDEEQSYFDMNVQIEADRTIQLRNNVAEGLASASLRIIGDTNRPGLVGTVQVVDGEAFLQDRKFVIDRGDITFNDPWSWDPDLNIDLLTDIESHEQRYRVNYLVLGPFSDWRTQTRSDPPMPQADVNALLWFGVTTEDLEEMGELSSAVAQSVADLILTDFVLTNTSGDLGGGVQDLLFDSIDLATGVNARGMYSSEPRLIVEKQLTELGDIGLTWEFNLVRPDDNYISAERRLGGVWSLAGWYASLQRNRVLPIGGAYGVDVTARWESQ
ncbi:MAG: hypothetical protein GWP91_16875 [Rhodobacterales bacterium]|nr:hypothetical protein [Rhodobacterales bacterium]